MAYNIDGKTYTDHPLLDEIVYNTKLIINDIILKNSAVADGAESAESLQQADYLLAIMNGSISFDFFPFTADMLLGYGYTTLQARTYILDRWKIPKQQREDLLKYCCQYFLDTYVETNNYYRTLNGEPEYESGEQYYVYINPNNPKLLDEDLYIEFNFDNPIHTYSTDELNTLDTIGIMDDILKRYTGPHYQYLHHLGQKKVGYYKARSAKIWDILYMPRVESVVAERFKELYNINRDIYYQRTYQDAFILDSDYYDEMIMLCIVCQTFTDIIVDTPEWYVRRDVFDLRTCQYFLESQGVKFFKQIPLKYQIRIVKNINKLIRYKSTTQNIFDILELFAVEGTTVYRYYLFKKWKNTIYEQTEDGIWLPNGNLAELDEDFDFGDDDIEEINNEDATIYDFIDDNTTLLRPGTKLEIYDFGDENAGDIDDDALFDYKEEKIEAARRIVDTDGNLYDLEFVKTPIGETYDDYIKNKVYRENYDTLTYLDPYWDGEDVHSYIKNKHLERDFTIEGTKYMSLEYKVSMEEYTTQMAYFLTLIFQAKFDISNIRITIPSIKPNVHFSLQNLFILLYCFNALFNDRESTIRLPEDHNIEPKPEYSNYPIVLDGGDVTTDLEDEQDINGHDPNIQQKYRQNYDGGVGEYSVVSHETFYDWLRWKYPYMWVDLSDHILGFNMDIDLEEVEKNINIRHSKFDFQHGFTLKDLACDTFRTANSIETIEELVDLYQNNLSCYRKLKEMLINTDDRDEKRVYQYVYDTLFTTSYPYELYRLHTGEYAKTYLDILKEKDYTLYKYYRSIERETNKEVRKEMVRGILNDIVSSLEHYISGENLEYVFSFVGTHTLDAIVQYIGLMINFFKSWKAYFLDPRVAYVLDDKTENTQFHNDTLAEIKTKWWYDDNHIHRDRMDYTEKYHVFDWRAERQKELLDIMAHYEPEKAILIYDGGDVEDHYDYDKNSNYESVAEDLPIVNGYYDVNGGDSYSKEPEFENILPPNPDNIAAPDPYDPNWRVPNLDFGDDDTMEIIRDRFTIYYDFGDDEDVICNTGKEVYDYDYNIEYDDEEGKEPEFFEPIEPNLDFTKYSLSKQIPYFQVNGGEVAARKDVYDLDGAGPMEMQDYLTIDGKNCTDLNHNTMVGNSITARKEEVFYTVDGGGASGYHTFSDTIITHIDPYQHVTMDVRISRYTKNAFTITEDGLYIPDIYQSQDEYTILQDEIIKSKEDYTKLLNDYKITIKAYGNYNSMCATIDDIFDDYFKDSNAFMRDIRNEYTKSRTQAYVYKKIGVLRNWFIDLNLFAWKDFDEEVEEVN